MGTMIDATDVVKSIFILLYTHLTDLIRSACVLCFARIEATLGYHDWCHGCYTIHIYIVFYPHRGDLRVP